MGNGRSAARGSEPTSKLVLASKWKGALSKVGVSLSSWCSGSFRTGGKYEQEQLLPVGMRAESLKHACTGWPFPRFISLFFPVFPYKSQHIDQEFQDIEFIARGSLGPILKVRQRTVEKTYALKVLLKAEVVRQGVLQQCKDAVVIQSATTTMMGTLADSGPPRSRWRRAECGCSQLSWVLPLMENVLLNERGHLILTDFGLSRRLWRGERASTICGTIGYMAPEVLRGSPYNHSADWWSLGILLYILIAGKFPVEPQDDHAAMLASVQRAHLPPPAPVSRSLDFLLAELLCADPQRRLHRLDAFSEHCFFHGLPFDPVLLQQLPLEPSQVAGDGPSLSQHPPHLFPDFDWEPLADSETPLAA
ncbi:ribosomal protein S6 kinase-related protein-like isoform X2 [Leucoraja erinacea]|uniref:ribosomal protein S6 kinase-related protein-like isoform X2 n=1 Tax=Leucoraja erinaceus TaxID=7782 RepID=UPI002458EC86|nr:ribosomal protein S6 kinase-related protein-like isoform X2 [Leucoraja erinacea]